MFPIDRQGPQVKTNFILVDFENVQPKSLKIIKDYDFRVIIFVGAQQSKIPFDLASTMQSLGDKASYIKIAGNGPNALDFHIAYYIGELASSNPGSYFHIISKDRGFDLLIKHLKDKRILISRHSKIEDIPLLRIANTTNLTQRVDAVIEFLKSRGNSKPRKVTTLKNSINNLFLKKIEEKELEEIIQNLVKKNFISTRENKVTYTLQ